MNLKSLLFSAVNASIKAGNEILTIYGKDDFQVELKEDESPLTIADLKSNEVITNALNDLDIPILSEEGKEIAFEERKSWDKYWLIDPLDGTKEFIKRNGEFTVNIALISNNKPLLGVIYAPVLKTLYFASEGIGSYKIETNSTFTEIDILIKNAIQLPSIENTDYKVVASRSHLSQETEDFINKLKKQNSDLESISKGSSLKLCLVAEGVADVYPRFAPTMEWDIAAGHAIVAHSGGIVKQFPSNKAIEYNKEELVNPWFIVISKNNKFIID